jgi:tocopherol cyclase
VLRGPLDSYRRAGADLPFADPARAHGTSMEGYYWRIVDVASGSVIVVLCGVCQGPDGPWATVALAGHPGGFSRYSLVAPATADSSGFGARAEGVLRGSADGVSAHLGEDAWVELRFRSALLWPRRVFGALGSAHALPGLEQYWHPVLLRADVVGEVCLGGVQRSLDGATAYAEKNWGPSFAREWWWGHADAFPAGDASVAFAGGRVSLGGRIVSPTVVVVRLGEKVLRFAPPLTRMRVAVTERAWRIRGHSLRYTVEVEGDAANSSPHLLPVPDVSTRRVDIRSAQHLAGRLLIRVSRDRRTVFESQSPLAGLERGLPVPAGEDG